MIKVKLPFGTFTITEKSKELIQKILESKYVTCGKYVKKFEDMFAEKHKVRNVVAVSSGTAADVLGLAALHSTGAKRGMEVIIPALTFIATANAVMHAGFKPVFVDIDPKTFNIDPKKIEEKITDKTLAIMPVHLMGKPCDMNSIMRIAKSHNLAVVEDAAEAHGAVYRGQPAGTIGDMGAFSLYVAHIITTAEGGIITTNNDHYDEILRSLRSHGRACKCKTCILNKGESYCKKRFSNSYGDSRFYFERIGYSCKMNELEAAIGIGAMQEYDEILKIRRRNLKYLMKAFREFPEIYTFEEENYETIGPHAFPFVVKSDKFTRDQLANHLEKNQIQTRTFFASIPTQYSAYSGYELGDFPHSENIGRNGLHIGVHQDLTLKHLDYMIQTTKEFLEKF